MKKAIIYSIFLGMSLFLTSCDIVNYDDVIAPIAIEIDAALPKTINTHFMLPAYDGFDITYEMDGITFKDEFIYTSPFYDQDKELKYTIKKGVSLKSYSTNVHVLADDSGFNQYQLYLQLPVSVEDVDQETYVQTSVQAIMDKNGEQIVEHTTNAAQLRGRGNSTWMFPKKPYRLRFDSNTSIFGMPKAKNYVLLAEYSDKSLMRNTIMQKMGSLVDGIAYSLETRFVELYINDEYRGIYVLTEQVEIHPNKFFIQSQPGVANTGYFIELDQRFYEQNITEGYDWIVVRGIPYEIKDPNPNDLAYTHLNADYIFEYIISVENALIDQHGYDQLMDVEAWVDYFILHELSKNVDVGWSSVFMYKETDGKLKPAHLWDFDLAFGNADYIDYGPEGFYGMKEFKNRLFRLMMEVPEIRSIFKERFSDLFFDVLPEVYQMVPVLYYSISDLAERNFEKWEIMDIYVWPNPSEVLAKNTHQGQVDYVVGFIEERAQWMYDTMLTDAYFNGEFE